MNLIGDLFEVIVNGLKQLSGKQFALTILMAILFSILCFIACSYYTKLWNKGFQTTLTHKLLSAIASALTFIFVLSFVGFSYFQQSALMMVNSWSNKIISDSQWSTNLFHKAYNNVKARGEEDFSQNPVPIPCSKNETRKYLSNFYADEVCKNFDASHRFLSKLIWAKPGLAPNRVENDMNNFFSKNPGQTYSLQNSVILASQNIKDDLERQTPRVVTLSKIILVIAFFIIQLIPFGLIGWAAYEDLHKNIRYSKTK